MEPPLKVQDQPQFLIVEVNMLYYRKIEKKKKKKKTQLCNFYHDMRRCISCNENNPFLLDDGAEFLVKDVN